MGELFDSLMAYGASDFYPCHMPGHKRNLRGALPETFVKADITEIEGFDNLHDPEGILLELQKKAARIYGAEESFFLVNGSTGGILSAISAALPRKSRILMARNSHKSAYHAAYLRQLEISFLYPEMMDDYFLFDAMTPQVVEKALQEHPDCKAVFLVSPTYEGRISDISSIAKLVHDKGLILIVDEAHGAHLGLAEGFARNSNQQGADIVIHSVHKTLPALTQSALLHVNGNRVDRELLKRFLHIYQSSSPSYLLMAGIDNALDIVDQRGKVLFADFYNHFYEMVTALERCKCFRFLPWEPLRQDVGKLVIDTLGAGISGKQLYNLLLERYHIQLEMAAESYGLAMFTIGDNKEGYERVVRALLELDEECYLHQVKTESIGKCEKHDNHQKKMIVGKAVLPGKERLIVEEPRDALSLWKAWDEEWEFVPVKSAIGRRVAEFVNLYPPGIPILVPGEILTSQISNHIGRYLEEELTVQGIVFTGEKAMIKCIK